MDLDLSQRVAVAGDLFYCCRWTCPVILYGCSGRSGPVPVLVDAEYVAVAGGPGPVPVLVDAGCGGCSRPDHLAWHTQ